MVLLGGCSGGATVEPTPSAEPTTSVPMPSPSVTSEAPVEPVPVATDRAGEPLVPPVRPPAMDNDDEAGARAAAEYFIELSGYAVRSQSLESLTEMCDPESIYCTAITDEVDSDVTAGNITVGGSKTFTVTDVDPPGESPFYVVWGTLARTPFTVFDSSGSTIYESDGDVALPFAVAVQYRPDGSWLVRGAEAEVVKPS